MINSEVSDEIITQILFFVSFNNLLFCNPSSYSTVLKIRSETCRTEAQFCQNLYMVKKASLPEVLPVRVCGPGLILKTDSISLFYIIFGEITSVSHIIESSNQSDTKPNLVSKFWLSTLVSYRDSPTVWCLCAFFLIGLQFYVPFLVKQEKMDNFMCLLEF